MCPLCGDEGILLYLHQRDRLFGAPGTWNLKRCPKKRCGLIWLDPMPLSDDIGKAYSRYYTHAAADSGKKTGLIRQIRELSERGYFATRYRYAAGQTPLFARILGMFLYLSPIHRREADARVRCLSSVGGGRLLDVGCGSGDWLLSMRERGWQVDGLDFDEKAVNAARQTGLPIRHGSLEQQKFPDDTFDAITLFHVVEHVPDPVQTLAECARILKKGGTLALFTPNSASLSHRIFGADWRGLEPPRHLHIFSMSSMRRALAVANFPEANVYPFIVSSLIRESLLLRNGGFDSMNASLRSYAEHAFVPLFKLIQLCALQFNPALGDCLIAIARKS